MDSGQHHLYETNLVGSVHVSPSSQCIRLVILGSPEVKEKTGFDLSGILLSLLSTNILVVHVDLRT